MFGSVTIASPLDSWSLGGTYSTGDSGRSLSLFSTLAPVDAATYVAMGPHGMLPAAGQLNPLQMLHLGTSAAILRLSDGPGRMNVTAILGGIRAAVAVGDRARTVGVIVFKEAGKELAKLAGRLVEESAKSATGGPKGDGPDGGKEPEDDEKDLLHNDLCNQEQMSQPGKITHRGDLDPMHEDYFRDAGKFAKDFGGSPLDYVKKTSTARTLANGKTSQVHWVENLKTGQRFNFKTKIGK